MLSDAGVDNMNLLHLPIKLVEVCQVLDPVKVKLRVFQHGVLVARNQLLHVCWSLVRCYAPKMNLWYCTYCP